MTLHTIDMDSLPEGVEEDLAAILTELQGLKVTTTAGALNGPHDINVAGIATEDTLVAVLRFHISTGTVVSVSNLLAEAAISSAGHIRCTTTDTTGDTLVVIWFNKS
jgi:hypothetical protein